MKRIQRMLVVGLGTLFLASVAWSQAPSKAQELLIKGIDDRDMAMIEEALKQGAKPYEVYDGGTLLMNGEAQPPIYWAAYIGTKEILKRLIPLGNDRTFEGRSLLQEAIRLDDDGSLTDMLVPGMWSDINLEGRNRSTALLTAVSEKNAIVVGKLLEAGANPSLGSRSGYTPLESLFGIGYSIENPEDNKKKIEVLKLLLAKNAKPTIIALSWARLGAMSKSPSIDHVVSMQAYELIKAQVLKEESRCKALPYLTAMVTRFEEINGFGGRPSIKKAHSTDYWELDYEESAIVRFIEDRGCVGLILSDKYPARYRLDLDSPAPR